ncbi:prokineticin-2 [Biomphalaria pfeifferi]|uniref:Prokineticin-2 n=1 Tax=Biomphalaria pfeifferi TaxID=112525 RepID=A0AAD8BLK6_BIOPF|nr:prokineticin-2 [Biomphalaria pfeifferi]
MVSPATMAMNYLILSICLFLCTGQLLSTAAQNCHQSTECARDHCCLLDKSLNVGVCKPMGGIAERCYVHQPYAYERPKEMVTDYDLCPCSTGNICGGIDSYHPVYGQRGICTFGK